MANTIYVLPPTYKYISEYLRRDTACNQSFVATVFTVHYEELKHLITTEVNKPFVCIAICILCVV